METIVLDHNATNKYPSHYYTIGSENHFRLDKSFIAQYNNLKPNFGFNGLGEFVYYRTYSRLKEDKTKENFVETLTRVVEGCYEIQRRHCAKQHIQWDYDKAQESAQEMFDRMWQFKFLPPGRGLWMMGTDFMWKSGSAALQNCAFTSTDISIEKDPVEPYCFMLDMSMLGVGVGFDTKGANNIKVYAPSGTYKYIIDDSREGWVDSTRRILKSYLVPNSKSVILDYSNIRPAGTPIKGFGGVAAGPDILRELHELIVAHLERKIGDVLTSVDITDLMNYIGRCVVAGNVRRTSQLALADADDVEYSSMKNATIHLTDEERQSFFACMATIYAEKRSQALLSDFENSNIPHSKLVYAVQTFNAMLHHRWASNNSLLAHVGMDYTDAAKLIAANGEPGFIWLDNMRDYGRAIDGRKPGIDGRVSGTNPCAEQSLESGELCNLCETFPANHDSADDYMRTLKFAYLYAKTVTLLPTHNSKANRIMLRNRRIGLSQSGIVQAISKFGLSTIIHDFCDAGYQEIRRWDDIYSDWLCISRSNKVTSIKPSGSVSLLAGATPGIHFPEARTYWRRVRIAKDNILAKIMAKAGYLVEPVITDPNTVVIKFAVSDPSVRPVNEVSIWEQVSLVSLYQSFWADNQVSVTIKFKNSEVDDIARVIAAHDHILKSISFLPQSDHGYAQAPYEPCSTQEVEQYNSVLSNVDYSEYIHEAAGSLYCDGDNCQIA